MTRSIKIKRIINAVVWVIIAIGLMLLAHKEWSVYGEYTGVDFMMSLILHGGLCAFFGNIVDHIIKA